jgi:hypothetical protein
LETRRDLRIVRGKGTECSSCGHFVPASHPVLLLENPVMVEVLGFYHRTCIAGAERLAKERPGELDLTVVRMASAGEKN